MKFSIGYNHDKRMLKLIESAKEFIESFYFPIPKEFSGSGRALDQKADYREEIKEIIKTCKNSKVKSLMLINASCDGKNTANKEYLKKLTDYLNSLKDLDGVILTNPILISEIKSKTNLEIHSSVNCYTKTVEQALDLKELGVDVLTLDRDINRNLDLIKEIKEKTGLKIKLLLNEGCLRNCPFRNIHFNAISHYSDTNEFDKRACTTILKKHPEKLFQIPFIRPEDLKHYRGIADYFKLGTRTMSTENILLVLKAYAEESYDGDLLFLLTGKGIFECFSEIDNKVLGKDFFEKIKDDKYAKELVKKFDIISSC